MGASRAPKLRRALFLWGLAACVGVLPLAAGAQVTVTTDDGADPENGSLRQQVEDSSVGETIDFRVGAPASPNSIQLDDTLTFDNDVELDNSSTGFGFIEIVAPDSDTFLEIEDGVTVTMRDLTLTASATNGDDNLDLDGVNAVLVLDIERSNRQWTFDVIGAGALVKEGERSLELTGENTFTGGITIDEGDVIGDGDSLGTGTISLAPDSSSETARLVFDFAGTDVFTPSILDNSSGGGEVGIVKRGSGTLDLTTAGAISGGLDFEIEDGSVVVDDTIVDQDNDFEVLEDGELTINFGAAVTSASVLTGEGRVAAVSTAAVDLVLTGDPSGFTGDFFVDGIAGSTVRLAPSAVPASGLSFTTSIDTGTTFELQDDFGVAFGGNVSGAGTFAKSGTGTTTLSGTHTHTGGTNLLGGTLVGSTTSLPGDVDLSAGTTLEFAQGFDATYSGMLLNGGGGTTVRKSGAGTLSLSAASGVGGDFDVDAGGLFLAAGAGLTNANLTIGTGGGSGASLSTAFDASAAAGAAINQYTVGGSLDFDSDATLTVGIAATTDVNTRINAGGTITVDPAATLVVEPAEGTYSTTQTWDILSGAAIAPGTVFDIQQSLFFFTINGAVVGGNTYRLSLSNSGNTLAGAATTANQAAIGAQLDTFRTAPIVPAIEPEIAAYQDAITSLTAAQVGAAVDAVSPDDLAAGTTIALANANRSWRGVSDRLALIRRGQIGRPMPGRRPLARPRPSVNAGPARGTSGAAPPPVDTKPPDTPDWQAWLEGQGLFGELDSSEAKEIEYTSGGPILGADRALGDAFRVGFALSGGAVAYESGSGSGEGDGGSVEGTAYAAWLGEPVQLIAGARYGRVWLDTERTIALGAVNDETNGDLEGDVFGGYLEATGSIMSLVRKATGRSHSFDVAPVASVAYTHLAWSAFDEGGASPLAVFVDEQEVDSVATGLGLRITAESAMEDGTMIRPRFKALWVHEWADVEREVSGTFASAGTTGTTPFTVEGAEMPRDHAEIGLGWEVGFAGNANLFFDWQGRFGEDLIENAISVGGRVAW